MNLRLASLAASVGLSLIGATAAEAGTVVQHFSYENSSFLGFDQSLGKLDRVVFDITNTTDFVFPVDGFAQYQSDLTYALIHLVRYRFDFAHLDQSTLQPATVATVGIANGAIHSEGGTSSVQLSVTGNTESTTNFFPIDFYSSAQNAEFLARFTTDQYINVFATHASNSATIGYTDQSGVGHYTITQPSSISGIFYSGQVTYEFSTAVPEPAAWALFILGFGAIGAAMRRTSRHQRGLQPAVSQK